MFEVEHYRKMGVADYGEAVNKLAVDAFYKGMATPPAAARPRPDCFRKPKPASSSHEDWRAGSSRSQAAL